MQTTLRYLSLILLLYSKLSLLAQSPQANAYSDVIDHIYLDEFKANKIKSMQLTVKKTERHKLFRAYDSPISNHMNAYEIHYRIDSNDFIIELHTDALLNIFSTRNPVQWYLEELITLQSLQAGDSAIVKLNRSNRIKEVKIYNRSSSHPEFWLRDKIKYVYDILGRILMRAHTDGYREQDYRMKYLAYDDDRSQIHFYEVDTFLPYLDVKDFPAFHRIKEVIQLDKIGAIIDHRRYLDDGMLLSIEKYTYDNLGKNSSWSQWNYFSELDSIGIVSRSVTHYLDSSKYTNYVYQLFWPQTPYSDALAGRPNWVNTTTQFDEIGFKRWLITSKASRLRSTTIIYKENLTEESQQSLGISNKYKCHATYHYNENTLLIKKEGFDRRYRFEFNYSYELNSDLMIKSELSEKY